MAKLASDINLYVSIKSVDVGIYTAYASKAMLFKKSMSYFMLTQAGDCLGMFQADWSSRQRSEHCVFPSIILPFCSIIQTIIPVSRTVLTPLLKYHFCDPWPATETRDPELLCLSVPAHSIAQTAKVALKCKSLKSQLLHFRK